MGVNLNEQETTITFSREGRTVHVWTSDSTVMTKLDRLCREHQENYKLVGIGVEKRNPENVLDKQYEISDKRLLSFRGARVTREYTEEEKAELRERLSKMRKKQREGDENERSIET